MQLERERGGRGEGGGTVYSRLHLFTIAPATYCPHVTTLATVIVCSVHVL